MEKKVLTIVLAVIKKRSSAALEVGLAVGMPAHDLDLNNVRLCVEQG